MQWTNKNDRILAFRMQNCSHQRIYLTYVVLVLHAIAWAGNSRWRYNVVKERWDRGFVMENQRKCCHPFMFFYLLFKVWAFSFILTIACQSREIEANGAWFEETGRPFWSYCEWFCLHESKGRRNARHKWWGMQIIYIYMYISLYVCLEWAPKLVGWFGWNLAHRGYSTRGVT